MKIWQLADLNKDGKLDRFEFSVAMKLVRNCLAGIPLPPTLPDSMRQISGGGGGQFPIGGPSMGQFNGGGPPAYSTPMAQPQMPPRPMSTYGTMPAMSSHGYRPLPYGGSFSAGLWTPHLFRHFLRSNSAQTPTMAPGGGTLPFQMGIKELGDWTLPQPLKLRFCQQFNQLDRSRVGLLTGQQARGVLGESQLPTQVLAQIWTMSDVNKDGCLSIEEFCTAQFLIEMVKVCICMFLVTHWFMIKLEKIQSGYALPSKLPNELNAFCHRSRTVSPSTVAPATPADPNAPPPQKGGVGNIRTFEDKRKDNLDKGQAELDRRRQILREEVCKIYFLKNFKINQTQEERRRAEIERREREEAERRERERMELERRREAELEAERQRELERDRERTLEEQRMKVQREEARRRLEMERIRELEKIRVRDLEVCDIVMDGWF
jgi:intersectin